MISIKGWLNRTEIDKAVVFAILARGWQMLAAPITLLLIARYFTPELQGFYYTFASLLALQTFVELGFYLVIINVASHEWANLGLDSDGRIVGDPDALSRLVSLGRLVFKWYAVASLLFIVGVGSVGYVFLSQSSDISIQWRFPWIVLVILTGLLLWALPFNSLLEGCNQVVTIQRFRMSQAMLETVFVWATMILGGGLWAAVMSAGVKLLRDLYLLLIQYRRFFEVFFKPPVGPHMSWKTDLWPMQWRLGLSGIVSYFAFALFNPVMFYYHGTVVAGQMGMTLTVVYGIQAIAMVWVHTKVPRFGMLIARKDYVDLDRFWLRTSLVSVVVAIGGAVIVEFLVYALNVIQNPLAGRLLAPLPTGLFLLAMILMQVGQCQTAYLRAHRQEPIVVLSIASGLAIGLLTWLWGSHYGPLGAAVGYLIIIMGSLIWETMIWLRLRAKWHAV